LLIFKLCLNISKATGAFPCRNDFPCFWLLCPLRCKATDEVTLPQLINFVDKQGREIRPLRVTSLPKSLLTKFIGNGKINKVN